jgi:hypothetical protein
MQATIYHESRALEVYDKDLGLALLQYERKRESFE